MIEDLEISIIHYPILSKPIIPSFQYSDIPIGAKPLSSKKRCVAL
jgi:hypothetical protein